MENKRTIKSSGIGFLCRCGECGRKNVDISKEDRIEVLKKRRDNEIEKMEKETVKVYYMRI